MKKGANQEPVNRWFWLVLLFLCLFFLGNNLSQLKRWWQANFLVSQEAERLAFLKEEYQRQQEEKKYVQTDDFVKKEAKEKLGLVESNEVRVVVPELGVKVTPTPSQNPPSWQRWWQLFGF